MVPPFSHFHENLEITPFSTIQSYPIMCIGVQDAREYAWTLKLKSGYNLNVHISEPTYIIFDIFVESKPVIFLLYCNNCGIHPRMTCGVVKTAYHLWCLIETNFQMVNNSAKHEFRIKKFLI